ncbi:MAG: hypothetical protein ACRDHG_01770 [Anaerolineales bacterium]
MDTFDVSQEAAGILFATLKPVYAALTDLMVELTAMAEGEPATHSLRFLPAPDVGSIVRDAARASWKPGA